MVWDGFYRFWGKKQAVQSNWVARGAKLMFSFASRARPGKHFLVEIDGGDAKGNDYDGECLFFLQNLFCLSFLPSLQETGEVRGRKRVEGI